MSFLKSRLNDLLRADDTQLKVERLIFPAVLSGSAPSAEFVFFFLILDSLSNAFSVLLIVLQQQSERSQFYADLSAAPS